MMRREMTLIRLTLAAGIVLALLAPARTTGVAHAQTADQTATSPAFSAAYDAEFEKARQLLQQRDYFNALKGFQRASQLAGGKSADAFLGMAQAMDGMKVYKNALDASQSAIDRAQHDAHLLARAHKMKGQIYEAMGELPSAESELRAAIAADPEGRVADVHFMLGRVLIAAHRDADGIAELRQEIEQRPNGTTADDARALIANPRRGREHYAPDFSVTALDGQPISLETLKGKIVLIDFWASWCGPCVRALPSVRKVQKDHARDPLVVVGISADREESAWKSFMSKNGMVWPQHWDRNGDLRRLFDVKAIPTYVLLDADGIELMRVSGSGFHEARNLSAEIDRQITLLAQPHP